MSDASVETRADGNWLYDNALVHWLGDRRVGVKFALVISVVALAATGVGLIGLAGMSELQRNSHQMYADNLVPITYLANSRASALSMRADVLNAEVSVDKASTDKFISKLADWDAAFNQAFSNYTRSAPPERATAIAQVTAGMQEYRQVRDQLLVPAAQRHDARAFAAARDSQGLPAYTKISEGLNGLIKAEIDSAAAKDKSGDQTYSTVQLEVIIALVGGLALAIAFGMLLANLVTRATRNVLRVLGAIAEGDLTHKANITTRDELGRMATSLDEATRRLRSTIESVGDNSHTLASAAEQLSALSQDIATGAEETTAQATTVSAAAEQVTRNIETVSASSEEMGASIGEIASSATEAANVAEQAVTASKTATATVSQLGRSSAEIGDVVKTITSIAEQTNLLALNATIEAARAGESGKGFAVVATEVKDLAQETARATQDISGRIDAIQRDASAAVQAITEITNVISSISQHSTTIAAAVEEQTATSGEISRNVTEAATGSADITKNITGVATAVQASTQALEDVRRSVADLARMSGDLRQVVGQFRY